MSDIKGKDASRSKSSLAQKEWEVAFNFVNVAAGNKTEAYLKYYRDHNITLPQYAAPQAHKFFKRKRVLELVEQFRAENREAFTEIRDNNVAILKDIATTTTNKKSDRIAAIKELNLMFGYNQHNVNVADQVITVELED